MYVHVYFLDAAYVCKYMLGVYLFLQSILVKTEIRIWAMFFCFNFSCLVFYYCKTGDKKSAFVFAEVNVNVKFGVGREEDVGVGDDDLQKFAALRASQRILASKWQTGLGRNEFVHQMYILRETALGEGPLISVTRFAKISPLWQI